MPNYQYQGTNRAGKGVKGKKTAKSQQALYTALKAEGIYVHSAFEVQTRVDTVYRLKAKELADFSRQIGTLQRTGVPVVKALSMMQEQDASPKVKKVYAKMHSFISLGNTLSLAMEQCDGAFPKLMINMYRSGEAGGTLDETAMKMAKYYSGEHKLNTKIRNATTYPAILAVMTVVVTLLMFTVILPNFFDIFEESGVELNALTSAVLGISQFIVNHWLMLGLAVGIGIFALVQMSKQPSVALKIDKWKVNFPKVGKLVQIIYTARFARTLSSLYSSGVSMMEAVEISVRTIGNRYVESQFDKVLVKINGGLPLSKSMEGVIGLEKKLISTIYIGEESGRLDEMLLSISEEYEYESDMAIERMLTYIEPIMIVIMAVVVGIVMLAVMVPVMDMRKTVG